jgi:ABC-type glycerol-3-phosphate transport system substrate-binding protein
MKKIISLLLALLLALSAAACSSSTENADETTPSSDVSSGDPAADAAEETETEKPWLDNLPDGLNFGGETCTMLIRSERIDDMFQFEMTGDSVIDVLCDRTIRLEDRLGTEFVTVTLPSDSGQWKSAISGSVQAGDGAYDIVFPDYWWGIELGGYYYNLLEAPYLDFSQPYWCAGWNDNDTFYGKLYTAVGDFSLDLVVNTEAVYFNKRLISDNGLENPYDLVKEDRWTSDKIVAMSETALRDLNGDGQYKPNDDLYGLIYNLHGGRGFLYAYGMKLGTKTSDGGWEINYYNDRFVRIFETVYKMQNETPSVFYNSNAIDMAARFASGNLLFLVSTLGTARGTALREMEDDFGLVPYPKLDETQADFISFNLGTSYAAILTSAKNPELSGAALEALCAENRKSVVPVLYEDALKEKYSRDQTTAEMLDILSRTIYYDFAFVNDAALSALCNLYFDTIASKNPDVASRYKANDKMTQKLLAKLLKSYQDD